VSRNPTHRNSLGQFGLDREQELQRFAPYCTRFGFDETSHAGRHASA
jgi:hypothetical protein